jgi:ketosteroid isomerase-like protein
MNATYTLNLAKSKYEAAYNTGDVALLLSVISGSFFDMSQVRPTCSGPEAKQALRLHAEQLAAKYNVRLEVTIFFSHVAGDTAYDVGMETWTLTPKSGGAAIRTETRYLEIWNREPDGEWRLGIFIDNPNLPPALLRAR